MSWGALILGAITGSFATYALVKETGVKLNPRKFTLNDNDRKEWVQNDEGLYRWWKSSGVGLGRFVRENRAEIDEAIYSTPGMAHFKPNPCGCVDKD